MFLCLVLFGALEWREEPLALRVSVIVPCHWSHFPLLENLVQHYAEQSVQPDEMVISLSEAGQIAAPVLDAFEQEKRPFLVTLLRQNEVCPPGKNRNIACAQTSGDLIVCQDADDLPHPQRIEIVKFLFEHYQIDHLLHQWLPSEEEQWPLYPFEGWLGACATFRSYDLIRTANVHNGSAVFLRELFEKSHWRPMQGIGEDALFNRSAYAFCRHKVVLLLPLIRYRGEFSTFDLNESIK